MKALFSEKGFKRGGGQQKQPQQQQQPRRQAKLPTSSTKSMRTPASTSSSSSSRDIISDSSGGFLLSPELKARLRKEGRDLTRTKGVTVKADTPGEEGTTVGETLTTYNAFAKSHEDLVAALQSPQGIYKTQLEAVEKIAPTILAIFRIMAESNEEARIATLAEKTKAAEALLNLRGRHKPLSLSSGGRFGAALSPHASGHQLQPHQEPLKHKKESKFIGPKDIVVLTAMGTLMFAKSQRASNTPQLGSCVMIDHGVPKRLFDDKNKLGQCLSADQSRNLLDEIIRVGEARAKRLGTDHESAVSITCDNFNKEVSDIIYYYSI